MDEAVKTDNYDSGIEQFIEHCRKRDIELYDFVDDSMSNEEIQQKILEWFDKQPKSEKQI